MEIANRKFGEGEKIKGNSISNNNQENKTVYIVLNIFRIVEYPRTFLICLYSNQIEYFKVDKSFSERIANGMVFVGDCVMIESISDDGIKIKVCENQYFSDQLVKLTEVDFFYLVKPLEGHIKANSTTDSNVSYTNYLPYLCDTIPYNRNLIPEVKATPIFKNGNFIGKYLVENREVSNIKIPLPQSFIAKVIQKTRINIYPTSFNPFFFLIVSSNDILIKVVFWSESLKKYSSLKVGDILLIKDYKMKKKWAAVDRLDYNTFTESLYYDVDEITAKDLVLIKYDKKAITINLFEVVEGFIEYMSLILRSNINGSLMEYILLKIDGKDVILFYNSDSKFYDLDLKMKIKISELRKVKRCGYEVFISTIYTQFEILQISDLFEQDCIFGALGFLPDNFENMQEVMDYQKKELINGIEIPTNLFMKPILTPISEIFKHSLVLNETKKFLINTVIVNISDVECIVTYTLNDRTMQQGSFQLILEENFKVFVYENFFIENSIDLKIFEKTGDRENILGKKINLVIEGFRADELNVIYYLTGIVKE